MDLRWEVLRAPWNQPKGSEKDAQDSEAIHTIGVLKSGDVVAAGRLQINSDTEGQIRYMCVAPAFQGQGLGKQVLNFLEFEAQRLGLSKITLNARANAVAFYARAGYGIVGEGPLLFEVIPHKIMTKKI